MLDRIGLLTLLIAMAWSAGCRSARVYPPPAPPPPAPAGAPPEAPPPPAPAPPPAAPEPAPDPLTVRPADGVIRVRAWAEPSHLPPGGGSAQILVRVTRSGGAPVEGVEVRFVTSAGRLFSGSRSLVTDARGMVRDQLTTAEAATVTLNAGGSRSSVLVAVAPR